MDEDKLIYFSKLIANGDYKRMADLLHLWRWSGIIKEELVELQAGLEECLNEIQKQLLGGYEK